MRGWGRNSGTARYCVCETRDVGSLEGGTANKHGDQGGGWLSLGCCSVGNLDLDLEVGMLNVVQVIKRITWCMKNDSDRAGEKEQYP